MARLLAAAVVVALAAGCGSPSSPAAPPPADAGPGVAILVDGERVATATAAMFAARTPLAAAIGPGADPARWRQVEASAGGGRTFSAARFGDAYRGQDAILYLDGDQPALGMFRRVAADAPAHVRDLARTPTASLAGITEIRIRAREIDRPRPPPPSLRLIAGTDRCELDAATLAEMAPAERARRTAERPTWDVAALAARCFGAAPDEIVAIHARGAGGAEVRLDRGAPAGRRVVVKINRRGETKARLVDGAGLPLAEATGVTEIEVELSR